MGIASALNIGASSLTTQQRAMDVLAHNIANVNTPGYSRQRPDLTTETPEARGGFNFGRGTKLATVFRQVDLALQRSLGNSASQRQRWTQETQALTAIENIFGSLSATGLAASFDKFFASWQQLANNPQDQAQKINVGVAADELVTTLTNMRNQLRTEQLNLDVLINQKLADANLLLQQVASLNVQIVRQENSASVQGPANDLRDQREQALQRLAEVIPIQRVDNPDGSSLVQTPGGDLLVQDGTAHLLTRSKNTNSNGFQDIVLETAPNVPLSSLTGGGAVGGMINVRDNRYGDYLAQLDSISKNLIFSTNKIYSNGASTTRGSTVSAGQASVVSSSKKAATLTAAQSAKSDTISLADSGVPLAAQIKSGSFKLVVYNGAGGSSTATISVKPTDSLNTIVTAINGAGIGATASVTNGKLTISAPTAPAGQSVAVTGDSSNFLKAFGIQSSLLDTSGVPFADQIKAGSFKIHIYDSAGNVVNAGGLTITIDPATMVLDDSADNGGTATTASVVGAINAAVTAFNATPPATPISLTASTSGGVLKLDTGTSGQTIGFSNDTSNFLAAYEINSFFHGGGTADLALDSVVAGNSARINTGTINSTTSAIFVGDNQTASAMFTLQQNKVSVDGTTSESLHQRYSNLSAQYGLDVANAQRQKTYRQAEFDSLTAQRNSVSGVNVDEELVSMIKFQRAYQSSAKVIQTVNQMLDSLMGLIR